MQTQREGAREGRREVCRRLGDRQYSLQPCFISKIYATASAGFPRLHVYERKQRYASKRRAWGFCWERYWCFCSCTLTTLCVGSRGEVSNQWPVSSGFFIKCPVMKRKCQTLVVVFEVERETRESSDYVSVKLRDPAPDPGRPLCVLVRASSCKFVGLLCVLSTCLLLWDPKL